MSTHFDIRPVVQKHTALPMDRLRVVNNSEDVRVSDIRRGIIFIFAAWSAPSVFAFGKFTKILSEIKTDSLELIVLDIDGLTADSAASLFGDATFRIGGGGEVAWVRDGYIVSRAMSCSESEALLRQHTKMLLGDQHNSTR